ncbi:MAG: RdgB/HAM1 family non-canonical purine NTP pyrophosphatase [bacterium]|nr:RdgB/HAM1 family non-canonical purine NTP pyrophosphatase [bacterium]
MSSPNLKQRLQSSGLVLASGNRHKIVEFHRMFDPLGIEVLSAADLGLDLDVAETADSFRGNAALKAREYYRHLGRPVIADDSGLVVDALDGAPGVYSARYGGPDLDDAGRRRFLLGELERVGAASAPANPLSQNDRSARFICVLALCMGDAGDGPDEYQAVDSDSGLLYFDGRAEGSILMEERGEGGFGYDPIFLDLESGKSFAELSPAAKDARSHRGAALKEFLRRLES